MKFFIDTANIDEIKKANEMGLVDGVTTNPSLVSKEGREFKDLIKEICGMVGGPVNAEVVSTDSKGMVDEATFMEDVRQTVAEFRRILAAALAGPARLRLRVPPV